MAVLEERLGRQEADVQRIASALEMSANENAEVSLATEPDEGARAAGPVVQFNIKVSPGLAKLFDGLSKGKPRRQFLAELIQHFGHSPPEADLHPAPVRRNWEEK